MKKIITMFLVMICCMSYSFAAVDTDREIKLNKMVYDDLSVSSETDYFSFDLSKAGSIKLEFEFDVLGEYRVKLVDLDNNKTIQSNTFKSEVNSVSGKVTKEGNKVRVGKGNYRVEVSSSWFNFSDEKYGLCVNYTAEKGDNYEKEPNNNAKTAMLIEANEKVNGNIESTWDTDYYMVEIDRPGVIQMRLTFVEDATYNATLYKDVDGKLKQLNSYKFENKLDSYTSIVTADRVRVDEGIYYVKLASSWTGFSNEDYTFELVHTTENNGDVEVEPNDDAKTATEIIKGDIVIGNMSSSKDVDYYMLHLPYGEEVVLQMKISEDAQYTVVTYCAKNGSLKKIQSETFKLPSSTRLTNVVEGKAFKVEMGGDYYFKITSSKYSNCDYEFLVKDNEGEKEEVKPVFPNGKNVIILQLNNPNMQVNTKTVSVDGDRGTTPFLYNGRTMLPIRAVIENLGGTVQYDIYSGMTTIKLGNVLVQLTNNSSLVYVNGVAKYLDTAPMIVNDRTMLPLRFVLENLGADVVWDSQRNTATITY